MATPKLFISKLLRRSRPTPFLLSSSSSSHSSIFQSHHRLTNSVSKPTLHFPSSLSTVHWFSPYNTFSLYRSISTSDSSTAQSEPSELGLGGDINGLQEISESLVDFSSGGEESILPQLFLNHRDIRKMLGLPDKEPPLAAADRGEMGNPGVTITDPPRMQRNISIQNLSPQELLTLSIKWLAKGQRDNAIPLLRLALDKDPEYVRALVIMGQTLMQKGLLAEATEYLERAISKLFLVGHSQEVEDVDLLILASQWAGVACIRQGKNAEGIVHLERLARLKEPEDAKSKAHYFDGLVLLSSALYREGRKVEASNYLRMAAAYNSEYKVYLEQCENDEDNFVSDLVNSRRGDY